MSLVCSGSLGQGLDSRCIQTDFTQDRLPYLSFSDVMTIAAALKGDSK